MHRTTRFLLSVLAFASAAALPAAADGPSPEGRLLRFPDIHGDVVVFVHGGDIWRAPAAGGEARRLTSHPGQELFPKISPDGKWIAYSAEYTGTRQVYVMPIGGGDPRQLTFRNDVGPMPPRGGYDDWILGWTHDGKILVRMNRTPWGERMGRYFLVDPKGGLETPLAPQHGGGASLSPDGAKLAFTPIDREFRTWKRTRGGRAQDIWIYDFKARRSERITDYPGSDNFPMWAGDTIYFASDRSRTINLFAYDLKTKAVRQLTRFDEYDVLWPSLGPGSIVFMNGGWLYKFDLASEKTEKIDVRLGAEAPLETPRFVAVAKNIAAASLSPSGARVVFEARGDLFSVPAKDGATRNLTGTQGVRERDPAWSPDGKSIAYVSDAGGEAEIYVRPQDGSAPARRLTSDGAPWKFAPVWSPDGKKIAYGDKARRLRVLDVASGAVVDVDRGDQDDLDEYRWSPDGRWLLYAKNHPNGLPGFAVWPAAGGRSATLGDGATADFNPVWSADGKYLFFLSNRDFHRAQSSFEFDFVYDRATRVFAAALDPAAPPLFPPKSDEERGPAEAKKDDAAKNGGAEKEAPAPETKVVADGFAARVVALPGVAAGDYGPLAAASGAVFYVRRGENGGALYRYDLKERKEEKVLDGASNFQLSADGKKLLYRSGQSFGVADARAGLRPDEGRLDLSGLRMKLDPRAEQRQIFDEAWRVFRDWFYDPAMHGADWRKVKERYAALLPFVDHRAELDWLMGEMVGELEAGHTYISEGDRPETPRVEGGLLGCDLAPDLSGRFRVARVLQGENWDEAYRSPLTEAGSEVREGEYLLAIDGVELTTRDNPFRPLEGKAGQLVALTVGPKPGFEGSRKVVVRTIADEGELRYIDWVKNRAALVDRLSGGKVGYIHLPDTAEAGNRMLQKLFYPQTRKPALIVDDRYNGGGFIPVRIVEYLSRRTIAYWARRDVESMRSPAFAHDGPKAMLINGYSSSGGDALPYWFKTLKLGPLVGTRTWGGLIGLSGTPRFVDGGAAEVPAFRIYDATGKWVVENEGVSPDVEVFDLPENFDETHDASIEKAVELLLKELASRPAPEPPRPSPPRHQ